MDITKRFLPIQCYASKKNQYKPKPFVVSGILQHYFSGRWAFPEDKFNPDKCWELMHDLNFEEEDRYYDIYSGPKLYASAHFFVARDGTITQMVPLEFQAWHAGRSEFQGRKFCNTFLIGIENIAAAGVSYTKEQMLGNARLSAWLMQKFSFDKKMITGHSTVAPTRKKDPGKLWNWEEYYKLIDNFL